MSGVRWIERVRADYGARGLGGRLGPPGRPAVVVVDLICGFTDPDCPLGSDLDAVVDETARLLDAARAAAAPIFFTTIAFDADDVGTTVWLRKMPALAVLRSGTPWVEVDVRLRRRPDEPILVKKAASAFHGTGLAAAVRSAGTDSVLICGATTSGCIRATAIDACSLNLPAYVPADCVGDRAQGPHEANLFDIDAKYADVIGVDEALRTVAAAS